jgi:HPt (histidine-containing phosphotransfer) domain-containing protein
MILDSKRLDDSSMGIPALREALLHTFLGDVHPRLERLTEAVGKGDARRIEFEAHGLKGMAATIGAIGCVSVFAELERLGREQRIVNASEPLARARAEVERAQRYIEESGSTQRLVA